MTSLRLEAIARTHPGLVREANEDSLCARSDAGLWAVADGMGGHERGEWASAQIVAALAELPPDPDMDRMAGAVADAIHRANAGIFEESERIGARMGSTIVSLVLVGRRFVLLWAGDSRGYLLRDGLLHRLSRDHSQVQEMVDRGLLTPEQAENHPMGHAIARAVGVQPALQLDAITDEVQPGDLFLLCSDGLHGVVPDEELAAILSQNGETGIADRLIERCLAGGAPDNVSVVVVGVHEPTLLVLSPAGSLPA